MSASGEGRGLRRTDVPKGAIIRPVRRSEGVGDRRRIAGDSWRVLVEGRENSSSFSSAWRLRFLGLSVLLLPSPLSEGARVGAEAAANAWVVVSSGREDWDEAESMYNLAVGRVLSSSSSSSSRERLLDLSLEAGLGADATDWATVVLAPSSAIPAAPELEIPDDVPDVLKNGGKAPGP